MAHSPRRLALVLFAAGFTVNCGGSTSDGGSSSGGASSSAASSRAGGSSGGGSSQASTSSSSAAGSSGGAKSSAGASSSSSSSSVGGSAGGTSSSSSAGDGTGGTSTSPMGGTSATSTGTGGASTAVGGSTGTGGTTSKTGGTSAVSSGTSTGTGGSAGKSSGGGTGGSATGGASGGSTSTAPSVSVAAACTSLAQKLAWPSAKGSPVTISGTKKVTDYDGGGALHEGTLEDCSSGDQSSTDPIIEVADGGSVKNVIFGKEIGDGIHCVGSCTIDNVWYPAICDDAITINKDGKASKASTISNSGFKGARDKIIQHNGGDSTLTISNVYAEVGGKLYRSCGEGGGCTTSAKHTVNVSNVIAIAVGQVVGVSENDQATLSGICAFRTNILCHTYKVGSDDDSTKGANGTGEGPSPNCSYKGSDTHALLDRVAGAPLSTDVLCPGSDSAKSGSNATACVAGFESCLKVCAPGMYGFKQLDCVAGKYDSSATGGCALVTSSQDSAAATALASGNSSSATSNVTKNKECAGKAWDWGKDSSNSANYCVCVQKPGYLGVPSKLVWDCQSPWW
jgi:pectate lyase